MNPCRMLFTCKYISHIYFGYFLMNKLDVFLENNFEPITQNQITQIALWRDSPKSPVVDFFIGCLNKFAVDQSQM